MRKIFKVCFLLAISHFSIEGVLASTQHIPVVPQFREVSDKVIKFCSIISSRDIICNDGDIKDTSQIFTPSESLQFSTDLKIMGITYQYTDSSTNLRFQIPYNVNGIPHKSPLFSYKKNPGNNTLNYFLESGCTYSKILYGYEKWKKNTIKNFATNVLLIINGQATEKDLSRRARQPSMNVAALILTSERLRSEKSLLISYIEFFKLQHDPRAQRIKQMFFGENPTLGFPGKGGQDRIWKMTHSDLERSFLDMSAVCLPEKPEEFFNNRLWDLWRLHEIHRDFSRILDLWSTSTYRPQISPAVFLLRESAPAELYYVFSNVFTGKQKLEDIFKKKLIEYDKRCSQFLLAYTPLRTVFQSEFKQLLRDATDSRSLEFSSWLLFTGKMFCPEILEDAISHAIDNVIQWNNIPESAYCLLFAAIANKYDITKMLIKWNTDHYRGREHLEDNLARSIVDEFLFDSSCQIFEKIKTQFYSDSLSDKIENILKKTMEERLDEEIEYGYEPETKKIDRFKSKIIDQPIINVNWISKEDLEK